ncbi:MAG: metallophosphoesterase, partial [Thermoleophilia bacterium]|nr:metallophosphoesterase [Thermoleophilia bacterium]
MTDVLAQLSDLHVQVGPRDTTAAERVQRAIELVRRIEPAPAAVLLSGDLVNTGSEAEYERLGELLGEL